MEAGTIPVGAKSGPGAKTAPTDTPLHGLDRFIVATAPDGLRLPSTEPPVEPSSRAFNQLKSGGDGNMFESPLLVVRRPVIEAVVR
ncbi:hypothetical protein MTP99_015266 [Tenebrio molitor]|jgi:hypothetical protein|nr:hypothetical protein MTP99_015266 [Tenebrio molitor]